MALRLHTIIASTRPGRVGPAFGTWFNEAAKAEGSFDAHLVDLADFNLPIYDEPRHPMMQKYEHEHTKAWAKSVAAADAYVFVTPEYNYGPPPALINALNYVYLEWNYKPASFVSYGGVSGGLRGVQVTKQILTTLKIMPIPQQVTIPSFFEHLKDGKFVPNELHNKSVIDVLADLKKIATALKPLHVG